MPVHVLYVFIPNLLYIFVFVYFQNVEFQDINGVNARKSRSKLCLVIYYDQLIISIIYLSGHVDINFDFSPLIAYYVQCTCTGLKSFYDALH